MTTATRPYTIVLTDSELRALGWLADRGYFPGRTYDALQCETEDEDAEEKTYSLAEAEVWAISELMEEDPDACFSCAGPELLAKLVALWESIV